MNKRRPSDADVNASVLVSDELRAWLRGHRPPLTPQVQAGALVYELTAIIALKAPTLAAAYTLVDTWAATMKDQIARLGVGAEHP